MAALLFSANPFSLFDFPLDDAWIHRVYSRAIAGGHGFAYNTPGPQEAGSTSPLWSIVTAPAHWLEPFGTPVIVLSIKLFGILLAGISIHFAFKISQHVLSCSIAAALATSVLAIDPRFVYSALSGMENSLLLALWLGGVHAHLSGRKIQAAVWISLLPVVRPEALVLLPLFALLIFFPVMEGYIKKSARRSAPAESVGSVAGRLCILPLPMLLWSLFCLHANGHPLPTTFYVKTEYAALHAEQLATFWTAIGHQGVFPSLIVVIGTISLLRRPGDAVFLLLVCSSVLYLAGVVLTREIDFCGYYWTRWTDPPAMLLTFCAALGIARLIPQKKRVFHLPVIVLLILSIPHFTANAVRWRARLASDCRSINLITVQAAKWIRDNTAPDAVVAVTDAGAIRYYGNRKTLDLVGLNSAEIAFSRNPIDLQEADYLATRAGQVRGTDMEAFLSPLTYFYLSPGEYTITTNPAQANIVIYQIPQSPEEIR